MRFFGEAALLLLQRVPFTSDEILLTVVTFQNIYFKCNDVERFAIMKM